MATWQPNLRTSGEVEFESYGLEHADSSISLVFSFNQLYGVGQSFTNTDASVLTSVSFYLARTAGTGTGTLSAEIYATTGTQGTSAVPTGAALAESDAVDENLLPVTSTLGSFEEVVFDFPAGVSLQEDTVYCIVLALNESTLTIRTAADTSGSTHEGNGSLANNAVGSSWTQAAIDFCHAVYIQGAGRSRSIPETKNSSEFVSEDKTLSGISTDADMLAEDSNGILTEAGDAVALESSSAGQEWGQLTKN